MRLLLALLLAVSGYAATIRGIVVDPGDGVIARAKVRLLDALSRKLQLRGETNDEGAFLLNTEVPGRYLLAIMSPGFQERLISVDVVADSADMGKLALGLAGCDAPGTFCDLMCGGPPQSCTFPPAPNSSDLTSRADCTVEADSLKLLCRNSRDTDLRVQFGADEVWLEAVNGATLAEPVGVNLRCGAPLARIRIDGLGRGSQFCLTTNRHHKSRIYLLDLVPQDAREVPLHLVTWP